MLVQPALDAELRAALPPALHVLVPDLAQLLADVQSGALPPEQARARLHDPTLLYILRDLVAPLSAASFHVGDIVNSTGIAIGPNARVTYQGPGYPRPNYRSEIAARLSFYGSVFVGREMLLANLMQPPAAAPGYSLITAPAGFGKSAVSAQLVERWEQGRWPAPRPALVYFFTRRETGDDTPVFYLQRVNAQLLDLLPQYEGGVPSDLASLRSQFSQLWTVAASQATAAAPLVLLVDGLDEMQAGPVTIASLLPGGLTPHVRVLVTSRPNPDPLDSVPTEHPLRAAARHILDRFDVSEIEQLLAHGGLGPVQAAGLAPEVLALTHGEPLFARFVAQETAQAGLVPEHLRRQPPKGVDDYFKRELDLLAKSASGDLARQVLGVLVVARAGLSRVDLAEILEREPLDIKTVLAALTRFLMGTERYELMHLELRRVVAAEFSQLGLDGYRQRLLDWCARYGEAGWPATTPGYILEQYAAHLEAVGRLDERHRLAIDPAFRAAQRAGLGDIGTTLATVRAALRAALDADDVGRAVECVAAYRETLRHGRLAETVFAALDARDGPGALRRASICGSDSAWAHVLWAYVAWELALSGQSGPAQQALAMISEPAVPPLSELFEALLVGTARALAGEDGRDPSDWLAAWGRAADAPQLEARYRQAQPVDLTAKAAEFQNLAAMAQNLVSQDANEASSGLYSQLYDIANPLDINNEEDAYRVGALREALSHFAAQAEGQVVIENFIGSTLPNPYPFYRNHALAALGVAALAVPVQGDPQAASWVRHQLRAMLSVALYGEGVTFTFDLPAMALALPHPPSAQAAELDALLQRGRNHVDRWGTHLRASSAAVAAAVHLGRKDLVTAAADLRTALAKPLGFAGFATMGLLAVANRCLELGLPFDQVAAGQGILDEAENSAAHVRDADFRARRVLLVHTYRSVWLSLPLPQLAEVPGLLARMPDRDMRLAYVEHLSARWSSAGERDWEALKGLVPFALSDATTLDAVMARLVGLAGTAPLPADLSPVIAACARDLATGRPWEYGQGLRPHDPRLMP